jgi:hypothetical protein
MMSRETLSVYALCRECAKEFGTTLAMREHAYLTGHVVIGTEENRIIVKRGPNHVFAA